MFLALAIYAFMLAGTFTAIVLKSGKPRDYEELCTILGGSALWFITLPLALLARRADQRLEKVQEERTKAWEEL